MERLRRARAGAVPGDQPFALVQQQEGALVITAVNQEAARQGVRAGACLADARACIPLLLSAPSELEADREALHRLALWCGRYGPRLNLDGDDGLWIDVTGVSHLFGGEAALLQDLVRRLGDFGVSASLGLGDTLGAAWALARYQSAASASASAGASAGAEARDNGAGQDAQGQGVHDRGAFRQKIAPAGETRDALAHLPVEGLRLEVKTLRLLRRLGLRRIGQLYDLPRVSLKRRFPSREVSEAVLRRLDQMLGVLPEPGKPLMPVPRFLARQMFSEPLITSDGLEVVLEVLAQQLCAKLARAHSGALRAVLALYRTDAQAICIEIGLSVASRTPSHFLQLFKAKLDGVDVGFGIDAISLGALAVEKLAPAQAGLEERADRTAPDELVDRLVNRLGRFRVFGLRPQQSHLPERSARRGRALGENDDWVEARQALPDRPLPLLLLPRPEPIAVIAEVPEGPPQRFRWRRCLRRIVRAEGPERIAPEWWTCLENRDGAARDYYRIEDEEGSRFWVFREGKYGSEILEGGMHEGPQWYLHGFFA